MFTLLISLASLSGKKETGKHGPQMKLVRATPGKYEPHGEFKVPGGGKGPFWAHPVISGGRLYIRHSDKLFVYGISGK